LWLLSQAWIAIHIWMPRAERLASTERLFVTPMYSVSIYILHLLELQIVLINIIVLICTGSPC
jgi:hypothetical protein